MHGRVDKLWQAGSALALLMAAENKTGLRS